MGKGGKKKKSPKQNTKQEKGKNKDSLEVNATNTNEIKATNTNEIKVEEKEANNFDEKKVAVSYKKLYQYFQDEEIDTSYLEGLKKKVSHFDLNPSLNFKLLSTLKKESKSEYTKYITKYKYTLDYKDAKKLKCFQDNEKDIIKESLSYNFDIKEIKSLSKIKLFNLLFYIINLKFSEKQFEGNFIDLIQNIYKKILSFANDADLIFKAPNNYGNYELQYYTFLGLFVKYFCKKMEFIFNENEEEEEENSINEEENQIKDLYEEDIFFDWDSNYYETKEKIDINKFKQGKNNLKEAIEKFISENIKINDNIQSMEIEKEKENNDKKNAVKKNQNTIKGNDENKKEEIDNKIFKKYSRFHRIHVNKLKKYEDELFHLFKEKDDNKILKDIEFIYYSILFTSDKSLNLYDSYVNCLSNNPKLNNDNFKGKYNCYIKPEFKKTIKSEELVYFNLDEDFDDRINNPFCNSVKYYKYPVLLTKNIFQTNGNIYELFKKYLKKIYKSDLLQELFYSTPEFADFKYPLLDDEILEEMIDNTVFFPFNHNILHGYTQKQFAKVYIASNLSKEDFNKKDLSKIIIEISLIVNTIIHEQFKHYIKGLLFYNSFRFKSNKRLYSDLSDFNDDSFYLDNIRKMYSKNKKEQFKPVIDGGHKAEIYLYGNILDKLYFEEALKMYDKSTWELSILEHLEQFNENNKSKHKIEQINIEQIKKNEKIDNFMKEIFIQFNNFYKCNDKISLNYTTSAERSNDIIDNTPKNELIFDYNDFVENNKIIIPDTETNEKQFYKYMQ